MNFGVAQRFQNFRKLMGIKRLSPTVFAQRTHGAQQRV